MRRFKAMSELICVCDLEKINYYFIALVYDHQCHDNFRNVGTDKAPSAITKVYSFRNISEETK